MRIRIMLFLYSLMFSFSLLSMVFQQPAWDDRLDLDSIEEQLRLYPIVELKEMRHYLKEQGKRAHYTKEVYLAVLANGLKAVFKPEEEPMRFAYGELVAYKASKWLGQRFVPPTVIVVYNGRRGSLQLYIESPFDLLKIHDNEKAHALLSAQQISDAHLFRFIFGQWDNHAGNEIIALVEVCGTLVARLALIDNAVIITPNRARYGEHVFIRQITLEDYNDSNDTATFPFDEAFCISLPIDTLLESGAFNLFSISCKKKRTAFHALPLSSLSNAKKYKTDNGQALVVQQFIDGWNTQALAGKLAKKLWAVVWKGGLWLQYYRNDDQVPSVLKPCISYTTQYYQSTLDRYKELSLEVLNFLFKEALESNVLHCTQELLLSILERRDQVLRAVQTTQVIVL